MKVASSARHQAGFTLLEVLLVAMLMGLVATAVTLSMGGARGDRELDKQARRFMATLQQAQEYSVMDGRLLGLRVEERGWQFMSRNPKDRKWQALTGDKILGQVQLPEEEWVWREPGGHSAPALHRPPDHWQRQCAKAQAAAPQPSGQAPGWLGLRAWRQVHRPPARAPPGALPCCGPESRWGCPPEWAVAGYQTAGETQ